MSRKAASHARAIARKGAITRRCTKCGRKAAMSQGIQIALYIKRTCRYCGFVERKSVV